MVKRCALCGDLIDDGRLCEDCRGEMEIESGHLDAILTENAEEESVHTDVEERE